jgi:hypothetical protein
MEDIKSNATISGRFLKKVSSGVSNNGRIVGACVCAQWSYFEGDYVFPYVLASECNTTISWTFWLPITHYVNWLLDRYIFLKQLHKFIFVYLNYGRALMEPFPKPLHPIHKPICWMYIYRTQIKWGFTKKNYLMTSKYVPEILLLLIFTSYNCPMYSVIHPNTVCSHS